MNFKLLIPGGGKTAGGWLGGTPPGPGGPCPAGGPRGGCCCPEGGLFIIQVQLGLAFPLSIKVKMYWEPSSVQSKHSLLNGKFFAVSNISPELKAKILKFHLCT